MSDIDNKKITSISDGSNAVPILWSINAKDIRYNNAIIMATVIARKMDKQNLWNGLINIKEKVAPFNIKKPSYKVIVPGITEILKENIQEGIKKSFAETIGATIVQRPNNKVTLLGTIKESFPIPTAEKLPVGTTPLAAGNLSKNVLYIELRNPINIGVLNEQENLSAFQVIVTVGTTTYYPDILNMSLTGQNTIQLTLDSNIMEESTQVITVSYDANKGSLEDSFNGGQVTSFQTSFNYEKKETDD